MLDSVPVTETSLHVTPHKRAMYISPKKKSSSSKKQKTPQTWKRNVRKDRKNKGLEYISSKGKTVQKKIVQPKDCSKCRFKCSILIDEHNREKLCENYYNLGSYERQRDFLCQMTDDTTPVRCIGKKSTTRKYHLQCNNERIRVCQDFFLKTLNIGKKTLAYTLEKKKGNFSKNDQRGK